MATERPLRVALVAGESSGDQLGAGLIEAIRRRLGGQVEFAGVAGPAMRNAGCEAWFDSDELAVMGLVEVLAHLPRLMRLRRKLYQRIVAQKPDVFIGIDAPDFNLGLEQRLRRGGIRTVHYVSPSVWAWRPKRAARMARCADLVLCLLPFEPKFYEDYGVVAEFVGHPLADSIPMRSERAAARSLLDMPAEGEVVALLPGSRASEIDRLGEEFALTAARLSVSRPGIRFIAPMATPGLHEKFAALLVVHAPDVPVRLVDRQAQQAIAAADAVLVASGTATLEALLLKRPMVVAYRLAQGTYILLEKLKLMNIRRFALPNLLAGREIVAEVLQDDLTPDKLATKIADLLERDNHDEYLQECDQIHRTLRRSASERAADAVLRLAGRAS